MFQVLLGVALSITNSEKSMVVSLVHDGCRVISMVVSSVHDGCRVISMVVSSVHDGRRVISMSFRAHVFTRQKSL